jgi:hypothetical protein
MSENPGESIANTIGAAKAVQFQESVSRGATYKDRFSKFWTSDSRRQNSFDLSGRGEIAFSGDGFVVRGFRREMLFMGSRIELAFERAHVADVSQSRNCLSFCIAPPDREMQSIKLWTEDQDAAGRIALALFLGLTDGAFLGY